MEKVFTSTAGGNHDDLRLIIFLSLFFIFATLEFIIPWRKRSLPRSKRWSQNLSLTLLNSIFAKFTLGGIPLAISYMCLQKEIGFIYLIEAHETVLIFLSFLFLDLFIYLQHLMFHAAPLLWRLHKVHHSDPDLDVTSGFRFHPIEILLSLILKSGAVMVSGAHPLGVLVFEILLNAGSLFNHSNINIPNWLEKYLSLIIVTPKFHLIHHSAAVEETNSNFSFTISVWDRIFGSLHKKSTYENILIGLKEYKKSKDLGILKLLLLPFENKAQGYSMSSKADTNKINGKS